MGSCRNRFRRCDIMIWEYPRRRAYQFASTALAAPKLAPWREADPAAFAWAAKRATARAIYVLLNRSTLVGILGGVKMLRSEARFRMGHSAREALRIMDVILKRSDPVLRHLIAS